MESKHLINPNCQKCESSQQRWNKQEQTVTQGKVMGLIIHLRCSLGLTV